MNRVLLFPVLLLAACSAPPDDTTYVTEPIIKDNVYDPLAAPAAPEAIITEPITSGPIDGAAITPEPVAPIPEAPAPLSDKERLVAAIAANGCVLNPSNSERILNELGIEEERLGEIGGELMREGRIEVVPPAEFRLITGTCA